jgi:hypothetical protein
VPQSRDWVSETRANFVNHQGKEHPSDPVVRKLREKRTNYYKVRPVVPLATLTTVMVMGPCASVRVTHSASKRSGAAWLS